VSGWVPLPLTPEEAAVLRAEGVRFEEVGRRSYRGPAWVREFLDRAPRLPLLRFAARAVAGGLDPDAVLASYALGGERAVEDIVREGRP
jgi:hypothetical protein